ncbi:hypothetical protein Tco_1257706 [Tanacetum coccineum]
MIVAHVTGCDVGRHLHPLYFNVFWCNTIYRGNPLPKAVWVKLYGVPVTAFSKDGLSAIATKLGTPLMLDSYISNMCMQSWGRSSYARAMIELRTYMELKDNIMVAMPKITREGHYKCNMHVEYEWKPPSNKKKGVDSTNKVSDSNPFKVLNSFDNDIEMGTNGGTSNLDNNEANSSGSLFWNVENSSTSTTPIMDKIGKFENLVIDGQAILLDEAGNPLKKIEYSGDLDSKDEFSRNGGDSYGNGDYDEDPYDDDVHEGQDLSEEIQTICDKLDIRVLDVVKNLNNPRQTTRGVMVGPKVSFKSTKQIYRHVTVLNQLNKLTVSNKNDTSISGKKKQVEVSRQVVSNSNPFNALNSIENDDDFGTNGVTSSSISTTHIAEMIDKFERQLIEGKLLLVDDDEKPLPKVVSTINADGDNEVKEVLWEKLKETKRDDDYDPNDDDLYDSHDMSNNLQTICDVFDITVWGRKKK